MSSQPLPPIREVLSAHGLRPEKKFGQNFLTDLNITRRIASYGGNLSGKYVVEVGPGPGALTRAILEQNPRELIVIEMDRRCLDILYEIQRIYPNLTIIAGDALKVSFEDLSAQRGEKLILMANLPYNVSTKLLTQWLHVAPIFESLTLMFQKEVAQRLVASPRTDAYGRLSIITQWIMDTKICFDLAPTVFIPPPKVTSTVVQFAPKTSFPPLQDIKLLEVLTAAAFGQRRKMLRSSLKSLDIDPLVILESAHITPTKRAEELSLQEFLILLEVYKKYLHSTKN